jgi:hypothetical protein
MDIKALLTTKHHDIAWVDRYLTFVLPTHPRTHPSTSGLIDRHHILPKSAFPDYASLDEHPWNQANLCPADHLIAHYYLFRALPGDPSVRQAFKMMVGFQFKKLQRSLYSEEFLAEIAAAYETARGLGKPWCLKARERRSESMKGKPVHARFGFQGREHRNDTKAKMSATRNQFFLEHPEHPAFTNKPSGENHWTYGKKRDEATRKKISQALLGHVQSEGTRMRRAASLALAKMPDYTEAETRAFAAALVVPTEEELIALRKPFASSRTAYTVLTGILLIRLGNATEKNKKSWRQASSWLHASGNLKFDTLIPATTSLGRGYRLPEGQLSAHELRKTNIPKGVTRARKAFEAIPAEEHEALGRAWDAGDKDALWNERKNWPVRSRPYNILSGMLDIRNGLGTPERFERWRQAGLWLMLSGRVCPIGPAAMALLPL